jgi:hypothetical protein
MALCPSTALYVPLPFYGYIWPSETLCALYAHLPLCGPLSLYAHYPFDSTALFPLYSSLAPLRPSVSSMAICLLYSPLSPVAFYPLYCPLFPLRTSVFSMIFYLL